MEESIRLRTEVILDTIKLTVLKSKVHGLSNMFRVSSKIMRFIWFLCFFTCMGYCVFQIIISFYQFFKWEVITIKRIYYQTPTEFPAIDICNLDAYDGNTARDTINQIINKEKLKAENYNQSREYVDNASNYIKANLESYANNKQFDLYVNGFYLSQMLISCYYNSEKCDANDFYFYHDYYYGSCYSFNNGKTNNASNGSSISIPVKTATTSGWTNGLQLELFVGNPQRQQQYNFKSGVRVLVRNRSDSAFPNDDGMDVATGIQTNIGVVRSFTKHLPYPYSNCLNDLTIDWNSNDVLKYMKKSFEFEVYSQKLCLKVCLQKLIIENCTCYDLKFKVNQSTQQIKRGCDKTEDLRCIKATEEGYYKNNKQIEDCIKKCPIECESEEFSMRTTYANYPSKWASNLMINNTKFIELVVNNTPGSKMSAPTMASLKSTVLMVNVYYEQMFYYETTEEPRLTLELLISTIGGHFGLFLGVTILSFVELVEIIFNLIYLVIRANCRFHKKT